jgi:CHAT domain-containing protein
VLRDRGKYADAEPLCRDALRMYWALAGAEAAVRSEGDALTLVASYPLVRDGFLSNARALRADPAAVYGEVWASKAALARVYERRALAARAAAANPEAAALLAKLTDRRRRRADLLLAPTPADPKARQKRDKDLADYAKEIAALDGEVRPLLPAVARAERLAKATPAGLQEALPAGTAVVDFLRYTWLEQDPKRPGKGGEKRTDSYLAFVAAKEKVAQIDLGPAAPLEDAIAAWRAAITGGGDVPPALPARVRELAWAKVRQAIPAGVKAVYVAPDAALCRLPWAALPGDRPGTILLEDYAVAVVPHAPFLLDKLWPPDPPTSRPTEALVVGGVAYDAEAPAPAQLALDRGDLPVRSGQKAMWPALVGTAAEAKGVAAAATAKKLTARTLGGEKASAAAVLAALPKARYAHLATHGFFADGSFRSAFQVDPRLFEMTRRGERVGAAALSPLVMTGLVLAGANKPNTPGRGIVTGEALVGVDLSGLELAVLSACETGLGDVAGGEGTFGLQRALHLAGTRDVVASLWKVPDRPTAALMALLYRNLWEKGLPPVEALRQAQLEIYRHPEKVAALAAGFRGKFEEVPGGGEAAGAPAAGGKAQPRLWAAFTLSGPGR